ncbi:MAG: hypothetical protein Q8L26_06200 [Candidatus Omnitrophota bacterium]|nr:hypothetical protein [Candidatus Omnitrophota bacterium]
MFNYIVKYITFPLYYSQRKIPLLRALRELEKSQWQSQEELKNLQWNKFKKLITYAYENTEYYHNLLDNDSINIESIKDWPDLERIPILPKEIARANLNKLISKKASKKNYYRSSGSSGMPITVYKDENALAWQMAAKWRGRRWNGIDIGDRILQLCGEDKDRTYLDAIEDRLVDNKTFFVAQEITKETIKKYLGLYHRIKPDLIYGYAHSIYEFAYLIKQGKLMVKHQPKVIICTSEVLWEHQKNLIEQVFGVKVKNEYGCKEFHLIAFECTYGNMHIAQENLIVEFLNNGLPAGEGEIADIVITDLTNYEMPLIRYKLGDRGSFKNTTCPCGRNLAIMDIKIGRDADMVKIENNINFHPDIFSIPHKMPYYDEVKAFKVIQNTLTDFKILIDASDNAKPHLKNHFDNVLSEYIGNDTNVEYSFISPIPKDPSGKLGYFRSNVK